MKKYLYYTEHENTEYIGEFEEEKIYNAIKAEIAKRDPNADIYYMRILGPYPDGKTLYDYGSWGMFYYTLDHKE